MNVRRIVPTITILTYAGGLSRVRGRSGHMDTLYRMFPDANAAASRGACRFRALFLRRGRA